MNIEDFGLEDRKVLWHAGLVRGLTAPDLLQRQGLRIAEAVKLMRAAWVFEQRKKDFLK